MKTNLSIYALSLLTIAAICACDDSSTTPATTVTFLATLNGASEVPANASTATGSATFTYTIATKMLSGTVTFSGITTATTVAHIHLGAVGVSGGPIFTLEASGPFTSPIEYTSPELTTAQYNDLFANLYYVNIHSTAFPNGEIRGQLLKQPGSGY